MSYDLTQDNICLGNGELYLAYMSNIKDLYDDNKIIPALKNVGNIASGASVTYKPTYTTIESENRPFIYLRSQDQATFTTGTLNFSPENVGFVMPVTHFPAELEYKYSIGGNAVSPILYLRFIHKQENGDIIQLDMHDCYCTNGSKFSFERTKPTTLDMEFTTTMIPGHDSTGLGVMTLSFINADDVNTNKWPIETVSDLKFTDTNNAQGQINGDLTWTLPTHADDIVGYNIWLLDSSGRKVGDKLGSVNQGITTFTLPSNVPVGGATQLAVFAYNLFGESQYSAKITFTDVKAA